MATWIPHFSFPRGAWYENHLNRDQLQLTQSGSCLTSMFFSLWKRKILYFNENNFSQLLFSMFYEKQKHLELKLDFWKQLLFSCTGCEALKMTEKLIDR